MNRAIEKDFSNIESHSLLLDLTRYLLAATVVLGHGAGFFLDYFDGFFPQTFPHPQSIAVVCFFFLSGFLIVGSQLRKARRGESRLSQYLIDRSTRVYITLLPSLLFVLAIDYFFVHLGFKGQYSTNLSATTFLKNLLLLPSTPFGTMRPIWSLMYEWWIYLLFAGFFFLKTNRFTASVLLGIGIYRVVQLGFNSEAGHIWAIWVLGGACAWFQSSEKMRAILIRINSTPLVFILASISALLYFQSKNAYNLPAGTLISLTLFLFICKDNEIVVSAKHAHFFQRLAGLSFTLFLTHYTILYYLKEYFLVENWTGLVLGFFASNLAAYLIATLTEYRLIDVKRMIPRQISFQRSASSIATPPKSDK